MDVFSVIKISKFYFYYFLEAAQIGAQRLKKTIGVA
jgi:hypothetical protein